MKNMFKMMGVALLAGAMLFTACKKDEETTTTTPTPAISVTFDETTWTSDVAMDYMGYFDVYKTATEPAYMQFCCGMQVGTYGFADNQNYVKYWDANDVEYDTPANDGSINVTAFDMNGKTISATINASIAASAVADGVQHSLSATLTNAKFDIAQ